MKNNKTALLWALILSLAFTVWKKENKTPATTSPMDGISAFKSNQTNPHNNSFAGALKINGHPGDTCPLWFLGKP